MTGVAERLRALFAHVRDMDHDRFDRWFAALLAIACAVDVATREGRHEVRSVTAVATALILATLLWRRRAPVTAVAAATAVLVVQELLDGGVTRNGMVPFVLLIVVYYSLGAFADRRGLRIGVAVAYPGLMADLLLSNTVPTDDFGDLLFGTMFVAVPILIGRGLRNHRELAATLADRADALEREREEQARRAVQAERDRIARELHDLVAHSIGAMTVQADAITRVVDSDPARARTSFEAIETTGREALTEMRRLLGVLRRDDEDSLLAPQPSLAHVDALAQRARAEGLEVELEVHGEARGLPGGVDLAAYRVVQEALAVAVQQPGARHARLRIAYGPREVALEVVDDRIAGGLERIGRDELAGMRERVGLYGGRLEAVAGEDGYAVRAWLPVELVTA